MITPSYSVTATERVLPKLALDFTTGTLDSRVTVTRALNTATRINSSGLLTVVNADLPRFDYDYTTLSSKGLLIEESRTNLITQSRDYSTVAWTKTAINVSACPDPSPTGATDAQTLTNSGGTGLITFVHAGTSGVAYTFSAWLRRRSGTGSVAMTDTNGNYIQLTLTSAWKRFTVVTTSSSSTTIRAYIRVYTSGDKVDVYNSQLELASFATSDIFTSGSIVTRNADAVSMTGTNFSDWYNATEGSFVVSGSTSSVAASRPIMQVSTGALSNGGPYIYYDPAGSRFSFRYYTSAGAASGVISYTAAGTPAINTNYRWAFGYKTDAFVMSVNGNTIAQDTSGEVSGTPDTLRIGNDTSGTYINGYLTSVRYWPQRFINAETQAFSK